jgi:hypothetical protein
MGTKVLFSVDVKAGHCGELLQQKLQPSQLGGVSFDDNQGVVGVLEDRAWEVGDQGVLDIP